MDEIRDIVAIDGPAGAGKSTVARRVAGALGYAFLDTGAMYRAATWRALHQGINLDDPAATERSTQAMALEMADGRVRVDDHDVTQVIRTAEVTRNVYKLDQNPHVRAHLVDLQRAFGVRQPTVAEGRDMGTVVFPRAKCKIYLDASLDARARRRADELQAAGTNVDLDVLREEIRVRDEKAMTRAVAPLRPAQDAIVIDTTSMTADEVVQRIANLARAAR